MKVKNLEYKTMRKIIGILTDIFPGLKQTDDNNESLINQVQNEILTDELYRRIVELQYCNMGNTLKTLEAYVQKSEEEENGLLLTRQQMQQAAQSLYWEWKREGLINEFNQFSDDVQKWIYTA